jgi:hypothetical protein
MVCGPVDEGLSLRWVVPASLPEHICKLAHYRNVSGHPGATNMIEAIRHKWFWPSMAQDCLDTSVGAPDTLPRDLNEARNVQSLSLSSLLYVRWSSSRSTFSALYPPPPVLIGWYCASLTVFRRCLWSFPLRTKPLWWLPTLSLTGGLPSLVSRLLSSDNGYAFASKFFGVLTHVLGVYHNPFLTKWQT